MRVLSLIPNRSEFIRKTIAATPNITHKELVQKWVGRGGRHTPDTAPSKDLFKKIVNASKNGDHKEPEKYSTDANTWQELPTKRVVPLQELVDTIKKENRIAQDDVARDHLVIVEKALDNIIFNDLPLNVGGTDPEVMTALLDCRRLVSSKIVALGK